MEQATEASRRAILEAGTSARTAFAGSVAGAQQDLSAQIGALLGGEQSQVMLRLQPLLEQFGRSLEERTLAQTSTLLEKVSKEFDPVDPASPMAQQMRALKDTQAVYAAAATDQHRVVAEKLDGLAAGLQTSQAVDRALARTAVKGATYEEQVHALLAEIAGGLGDEYAETGNVVGLRTRSKKGDGVLRVPDPEARVVVEMTDSPRSGWVDYLKEAEDNRGAQAALGLVLVRAADRRADPDARSASGRDGLRPADRRSAPAPLRHPAVAPGRDRGGGSSGERRARHGGRAPGRRPAGPAARPGTHGTGRYRDAGAR